MIPIGNSKPDSFGRLVLDRAVEDQPGRPHLRLAAPLGQLRDVDPVPEVALAGLGQGLHVPRVYLILIRGMAATEGPGPLAGELGPERRDGRVGPPDLPEPGLHAVRAGRRSQNRVNSGPHSARSSGQNRRKVSLPAMRRNTLSHPRPIVASS